MKTTPPLLHLAYFILASLVLITPAYGSSAKKGYTDKDLIKYASSKEAFKASLSLQYPKSRCTINSVKIKNNDPYDFFLTAAHCADMEKIWNKKLTKEQLDEEKQIWPYIEMTLLSEGIISAKSSSQDVRNAWNKYRESSLNASDIISINAIHQMKCALPDQSELDIFQDIALCTLYQKYSNRLKYELFLLKDPEALKNKILTHVGFGERNTGNIVTDKIKARQAFKTLVNFEHTAFNHGTLWSVPFDQIDIPGPIAAVQSGDSGGALLYEDRDGKFFLAGITAQGHSDEKHSGIWVPIYEDFIEQAYHELLSRDKDEL